MKKKAPRLVLNRETIRQLDKPALPWVVGGLSEDTGEQTCGPNSGVFCSDKTGG